MAELKKDVGALQLLYSYLVLNISTGIVGGAMMIAVPCYALTLLASTSQIGLIKGVSGLGMVLLVIPAGFLVDHIGSKKLYLGGALVGTIITLSLIFVNAPEWMILIMGLSGLFQSLKSTALNASFYSDIKRIGIEKSGWFKGSMSIGLTFIGPVFGGFLIERFSYHTVFAILSVLTLIPITLVWVFHQDTKRERSTKGFGEVVREQTADFIGLLKNRSLYLPLLTESFSTGCFSLFAAFIVVLAVQTLHLPTTTTSFLITIEGSLFIATVFIAGPLLKILSQFKLYLLSISVAISALVLLSIAANYETIVIASVLLGIGTGLLNLITSARLGQYEGDKGKLVGLFAAALGLGISMGPILGGYIAQSFGVRAAFLTFVPIFLVLLLYAWIRRNESKEADRCTGDSVDISSAESI